MTKLAYLAKVVLIVFYKRHDKLRLMAIIVYLPLLFWNWRLGLDDIPGKG
jgi:hypothetical protein